MASVSKKLNQPMSVDAKHRVNHKVDNNLSTQGISPVVSIDVPQVPVVFCVRSPGQFSNLVLSAVNRGNLSRCAPV